MGGPFDDTGSSDAGSVSGGGSVSDDNVMGPFDDTGSSDGGSVPITSSITTTTTPTTTTETATTTTTKDAKTPFMAIMLTTSGRSCNGAGIHPSGWRTYGKQASARSCSEACFADDICNYAEWNEMNNFCNAFVNSCEGSNM